MFVEEIEERIEGIDCELALLAPLVHERTRLLRARAAILGEPDPDVTRDARAGLTADEVFSYLIRNPGSRTAEVAAGLQAGRAAVSAHLRRGKGRRFSVTGGRWFPIPCASPVR